MSNRTFLTMAEKRAYIDEDFAARFEKFRKFPLKANAKLLYIQHFRVAANEWMERYKDKSLNGYAMSLLDDLMRSIELRAKL